MKVLLVVAKNSYKHKLNFSRSALPHMKTRASQYPANDCSLSVKTLVIKEYVNMEEVYYISRWQKSIIVNFV